jgi:hypothetical protein
VYDSPNYPTNQRAAEAFVDAQLHGTLLGCVPGSPPEATILPFVRRGELIEVHCVREDPTLRAVASTGLATFLVSDFLAWTPHDWVEPTNAARATLHFKAVLFRCSAEVLYEPDDVAAVLGRLLARYEPTGVFDPIEDGQTYGERLRRLAAIVLRVTSVQPKFKLGPYGPDQLKESVAARLRQRGWPTDDRAATAIEEALRFDAR